MTAYVAEKRVLVQPTNGPESASTKSVKPSIYHTLDLAQLSLLDALIRDACTLVTNAHLHGLPYYCCLYLPL